MARMAKLTSTAFIKQLGHGHCFLHNLIADYHHFKQYAMQVNKGLFILYPLLLDLLLTSSAPDI